MSVVEFSQLLIIITLFNECLATNNLELSLEVRCLWLVVVSNLTAGDSLHTNTALVQKVFPLRYCVNI